MGVDAKLSIIQPIIFWRYSNNIEKSKVLSSVKVHFATDCDINCSSTKEYPKIYT